jgi:hypothetical protein
MPEPDIIGRTICEIGLWLDMPEEQEANGTFIVRAVNCHKELVAALDLVDTVSWPEDYGGWRCTFDDKEWQQIQGALAKAKEGVADETRLRQQDLDEETL